MVEVSDVTKEMSGTIQSLNYVQLLGINKALPTCIPSLQAKNDFTK